MKLPKLQGVRIEPKPPKKRYEDSDVHSKSSDIVTYSLFEQSWDDLVSEGLAHIFNHDSKIFEQRKEEAKCKEEMAEMETEATELAEEVDEGTELEVDLLDL